MGANHIDSAEAAAAYLYGLAPAGFVAARNQLSNELRSSGRGDLAKEVKALRRPTVLAAELNRVLRQRSELVDTLLSTAIALHRGQQRLLAGDAVDLGELQTAHRAATADVTDWAERDRAEIQAAVEAASLDEALHEALRAATFAVEPAPQIGFDLLTPHPGATVTSLTEARARKRLVEESDKQRRQPRRQTHPTERSSVPGTGRERAGPVRSHKTVSTQLSEEEAAAGLDEATRSHNLAQRRLDAAGKASTKARQRVAVAEERLAAARGHLADSEAKLVGARRAEARAREQLKTARETAEPSGD